MAIQSIVRDWKTEIQIPKFQNIECHSRFPQFPCMLIFDHSGKLRVQQYFVCYAVLLTQYCWKLELLQEISILAKQRRNTLSNFGVFNGWFRALEIFPPGRRFKFVSFSSWYDRFSVFDSVFYANLFKACVFAENSSHSRFPWCWYLITLVSCRFNSTLFCCTSDAILLEACGLAGNFSFSKILIFMRKNFVIYDNFWSFCVLKFIICWYHNVQIWNRFLYQSQENQG